MKLVKEHIPSVSSIYLNLMPKAVQPDDGSNRDTKYSKAKLNKFLINNNLHLKELSIIDYQNNYRPSLGISLPTFVVWKDSA